MESENTKPSNPNAFACVTESFIQEGMELRDYFAAKAMQGLLSNPKLMDRITFNESTLEADASNYYAIADAMLKRREL